MDEQQLLELIKEERPTLNIIEIISFREIVPGSYWVKINTGLMYYESIIYPKLKPGTNVLNLPHYD
jgi:hypothetical protein